MKIGKYVKRTYKICNLTMRFLKYKFNDKLLSSVTSLKFTLGVT